MTEPRASAAAVACSRARSLLVLAVASAVAACGGADAPAPATDAGASPFSAVLSPDVPRWRGGCFFDGPAGKIVNGSPAPDIRPFGSACATPPGPGGLVYLDRYDPASGLGDVTVLAASPGSSPVVIARHGGGGTADPGTSGARLDATHARVLALSDVSFVTGRLVVADLPAATVVQPIATAVRVDNYEFVADGGVLLVGHYDAATREGDLLYWNGGAVRTLARGASRFDFVMYRLDPARARVAYLRGYTAEGGGDLFVQPVPPSGPEPPPLASRVYRMSWTVDGAHLVYRTLNGDGFTYALWSWDGASAPRPLAPSVGTADVVGGDVLYTTDWSVLTGRAGLHLVSAAGGPDRLAPGAPASPAFAASRPTGTAGALAFVDATEPSDPLSGDLFLGRLDGGPPPARKDALVSGAAGFGFSPGTGFVSYAVGFEQPLAPASASAQPGIAREVKVAAVAGGAPFVLAEAASPFVAWDPQDRFAAGLARLAPAGSVGSLVVRSTADGALLLASERVGLAAFGFAADGSALWAIREWDDAMQRGELLLAPTSVSAAWEATAVDANVTVVAGVASGRAVYGVQGGGRDGLWLGPDR